MLQGVSKTVSRQLVSVLECQYRYSSPKGGLGTDTPPLVPIPSGNTRGLTIKVDLCKPLASMIIINGNMQLTEYESLPLVYFHCGQYGHTQDTCSDATNQPSAIALE
ncbi:hypothetical protein GQ457_04G023510 [Hibiscus cannabinus]